MSQTRRPLPSVPLNNKQKAQVKQIALGVHETQYDDRIHALENLSWSGTIPLTMTNVPVADRVAQSDKIRAMWLSIDGDVRANGTASVVRIIVFRWKPDTASDTPAAASILGGSLSTLSTPYSHYTTDVDRKRFVVLKDRTFNALEGQSDIRSFHWKFKLNRDQYFNDGATTGKDQIYALAISDKGAANFPQYQFRSRLSYKEI